MNAFEQFRLNVTRRHFLGTGTNLLGTAALASLAGNGLANSAAAAGAVPHALTHFAPKAKSCIFFLPAGAPSHLDLYDPKPRLNELHGQKMPDSMTANVRFAFIKKETAVLWGSKRKFTPHGECGTELSDFLPHIGTRTQYPLWVPNLFGSAFYIFLLRQFFLGIPRDLFEAARIDGDTYFSMFRRIALPLAKPALID